MYRSGVIMNDDLEQKIKDIATMLNDKGNSSDDLMSLVDKFKGGNSDDLMNLIDKFKGSTEKEAAEDAQSKHYGNLPIQASSKPDDTMQTMLMLKKIMSMTDSKNDPKVALLNSIKPFLKKSRQDKLSNCIKILNMFKITKYMDLDKNG